MNGKDIGALVVLAVGLIVGLVLLQQAAQQTSDMLNLGHIDNKTITLSSTAVTLEGKAASNVVVTNATGGETVPASNYTISNNVILDDGTLGCTIVETAGPYDSVNITYDYQPVSYADSATRNVVPLIVILSALALAVVALVPTLRSGVVSMLGLK